MDTKPFHLFFAILLLFFVFQPLLIKSLELESLQYLQHSQKGDIMNGIIHIKKYLNIYGYYPPDFKPALNNHFDDSLESALKAYQKYSSLSVTGKIDSDTIEAMMIPRCGLPDNFLVGKYDFPGFKWKTYDLTYTIKNDVDVISENDLDPIIAASLKSWGDVSPFNFTKAEQPDAADIKVGFVPATHTEDPYPLPKNVGAHAFFPEQLPQYAGMLHFNSEINKHWTLNPTQDNDMDVHSIAVHEFGHTLGLNHSYDPNAVMFAYFFGGKRTKRTLGEDDIEGLKALYGY